MRSPSPSFDLRAALSEQVRAALGELDSAGIKRNGVHRCRLAIKRARALARVGRSCAPGLAVVFNDSARAVMASLAVARDLHALADSARALAEKCGRKTAAALMLMAERLDAAHAMLPAINENFVRAGLKDLLALAQVWPEASGRQIRKGAQRIARRARLARERGLGASEAARRHDWRKREKERFYAIALLGEAWPGERRRKTSERLGELLGQERDALLLIERVNGGALLQGRAASRALTALTARREQLGARADILGAKLHAGGA